MTALQRIIKYCAVAFAVFLIVAIISGICGAISMVSFFFDGDAAGEMQTYTVSSDVESLDLEVSGAALEIVTGDSFSVESNHKYLSVKEDNGALRISEEKILFGVSSDGVTVILTVPEGFVFEDAAISAGGYVFRKCAKPGFGCRCGRYWLPERQFQSTDQWRNRQTDDPERRAS